MPKKPITKEGAIARLESLCSRSEQCEYDLDRKMINWGLNSTQRKEILVHLKENKYLDNARFSRSYVNDKARFSSWGPYRIRLELIKKRIDKTFIDDALRQVDPAIWKEGLLKCAVSKTKNLDLTGEEGYSECQKLFRYLISRGFPSTASSKAVKMMKKKQEEMEE